MSGSSASDLVECSANSFFVSFRRNLYTSLGKVHPPRNQIYRTIYNLPLVVFKLFWGEHATLCTVRCKNYTTRTVVLGSQAEVDALLVLHTVDSSKALGSFRFTARGESHCCSNTVPATLLLHHKSHSKMYDVFFQLARTFSVV
jgi:hypothetical protein